MTEPVLLARHQINDTYWNTLIDEAVHPVVYAYTWYLDIVSPHWQALVFPQSDGYMMVMPLPVRKKWGFRMIQQPFFCQYLGIYSRYSLSGPEVKAFFQKLHGHFSYISLYAFHPDNSPVLASYLPDDNRLTYQTTQTHWLNLRQSYDNIANQYNPDRKTNLQRARNYHWQMVESKDMEPLIQLFRQYHAPQIRGGVAESAYELLQNLGKQLVQKKMARICYAQLDGQIHAGVMIIETERMSIYIFNAADSVGREGNARTWLLDGYFKEKTGKQITCFDFESPEVDSIGSFYKSFGAEERAFITIQKNKLPFPIRQLQKWRKRWLTAT